MQLEVGNCMEIVRVTQLSHTLVVLAMNQIFLIVHLTNPMKVLNVVISKMPTSFAKVYCAGDKHNCSTKSYN